MKRKLLYGALVLTLMLSLSSTVSAQEGEPHDRFEGRELPAELERLKLGAPVEASGVTMNGRGARLPGAEGTQQVIIRLTTNSVSEAKARGNALGLAKNQADVQQQDFLSRVLTIDPDARVLGRVQLVMNAVFVQVDAAALPTLASDPAVTRIAPVGRYEMDLSETVPYIGATTVQDLGFDGTGVRVAVLDSGIDYYHAALGGSGNPADYVADDPTIIEPGTFPTAKVIGGYDFVGSAWFGADGPPEAPDPDPLDDGPGAGHGTHVAHIVGGFNGVAPGVDLYAVKVCSSVSTACSGIALIQGMEFAVDPDGDGDPSDAVDIINMSLGASYGQPFDDDLSFAVDNATALGVLTVASAGNGADKPYVTGTASSVATALSVAQTQVPSAKLQLLDVDGVNYPAVFQPWSVPLSSMLSGPVQYGDGVGGNLNGCASFAPDSLTGKIVLVDRGECNFSLKISNISQAGALVGIIGLVAPGAPFASSDGGDRPIDIPGYMMSQADSDAIKARIGNPGIATFDPTNQMSVVGQMVGSSSRGPQHESTTLIKPEIGAPGASVSALAGTGTGQGPFGGTSGAAPMVAGSAALLLDAYADGDDDDGRFASAAQRDDDDADDDNGDDIDDEDGDDDDDDDDDGDDADDDCDDDDDDRDDDDDCDDDCDDDDDDRDGDDDCDDDCDGDDDDCDGDDDDDYDDDDYDDGRRLSPFELKALLMNNGETDIDTDPFTGLAPITRIGGGEVRVDRALSAPAAAWDKDTLQGALSFGFVDVSKNTVILRKKVRVRNYSDEDIVYRITATFRYADDEASRAVSIKAPRKIRVKAGRDETFTVRLRIKGARLEGNYLNSGSMGADPSGLTRNEYDGYLILDDGSHPIHLAWHVLPRKAAKVVGRTTLDFDGGVDVVSLKNRGVGTAQNDAYSLIAVSPNLQEGAPGDQSPTPDIKGVGTNTFIVSDDPTTPVNENFCTDPTTNAETSFVWAFAINTWERQEHLLPVSHQVWLDTNQDGNSDFVVLNRDVSGFSTISDGRQVTWVLDLATGFASAFFFAEHAMNTGNTVLWICGEQVGLTSTDILATNVDVSVVAQDFYYGGPGDLVSGITVTPLGEEYFGIPDDIAGKSKGGMQVIDYGPFPGNSPELGVMLVTNGDRGGGNRGGATQDTEALWFAAPGVDLSDLEPAPPPPPPDDDNHDDD